MKETKNKEIGTNSLRAGKNNSKPNKYNRVCTWDIDGYTVFLFDESRELVDTLDLVVIIDDHINTLKEKEAKA